MKKIDWKFYKPYRDKLVDKKNELLSKLFDKNKTDININPSEIKKILFLRIDGKIGDYTISSFLYREIKKNYPHIQVDIVADRSLEGLLKLNKYIDNYYVFNRKKLNEWKLMIKRLKNENYDIIIDSTEGLKYKQVYFLNRMNAKINIGYNKDNYKIYNKNIKQDNTLKMKEIYIKMLESVNIKIKDTTYDVPILEEAEEKVNQFFEENNINENNEKEKIMAVNFFGASRGRKMKVEQSLILLRKLREKYKSYKIIILDSPIDRDTIYKILEQVKDKNTFFFEKSKTIFDSISIINKSTLVVSLDTSILHIAEGLNKKIMAFYGPKINKNKWRIKEEGNILIDFPEKNIIDVDFEKLL